MDNNAGARAAIVRGAAARISWTSCKQAFGERLGRFTAVERRASFPLALQVARHVSGAAHGADRQRRADAAPGCGAGPEPGPARRVGARHGTEALAARATSAPRGRSRSYAARRRLDRGGGIWFTHDLVRLFSGDVAPLAARAGSGLAALGAMPPAKDFVVRRMTFGARG